MTSSGPTVCWRWLSGDLTGEERGRDRGNPLAGSSTVNRLELGVPGEAETHRYKKVAVGAMDDLKIDLSLDVCPSPRDLSGRRLHRRPGAWQPGGASLPRLLRLLLLPSALHRVAAPTPELTTNQRPNPLWRGSLSREYP